MTPREKTIEIAILTALKNCGAFLMPQAPLQTEIRLSLAGPELLASEFEDRLRHLESRRLILGTPTDYGVKWKLTAEGRAHCAENKI